MKVIHVARKPLQGTVAKNALEHGTGGLNIALSRIGTGGDRTPGGRSGSTALRLYRSDSSSVLEDGFHAERRDRPTGGRFPANLILEHRPGCRCTGSKKIKGGNDPRGSDGKRHGGDGLFVEGGGHGTHVSSHDGYSAPGCPVAALDASSGEVHSAVPYPSNSKTRNGATSFQPSQGQLYADKGGASRFFKQVADDHEIIE